MGGAWRGQRLGIVHVAGATLGLMAVVCIVWVDVEGAPTDGKLYSSDTKLPIRLHCCLTAIYKLAIRQQLISIYNSLACHCILPQPFTLVLTKKV